VKISPFTLLLGGVGAGVMGFLFRFRMLPFLKPDIIIKGGHPIPTEQYANWMSTGFFIFGSVFLAGAFIVLALKARK